MEILLHRRFKKQYKKLSAKEKERFKERRSIFLVNPFSHLLNNHSLTGKYKGYLSINITGDIRVLYQPLDEDTVRFVFIGTHSELYS